MVKVRVVLAALMTILDEVALLMVALFVLPLLGVEVPIPVLAGLLVLVAFLSFSLFKVLTPVLSRRPMVGLEALIGSEAEAVTPLNPSGFIMVKGELWKARSLELEVKTGEKLVIVAKNGVELLVKRKQTPSN